VSPLVHFHVVHIQLDSLTDRLWLLTRLC